MKMYIVTSIKMPNAFVGSHFGVCYTHQPNSHHTTGVLQRRLWSAGKRHWQANRAHHQDPKVRGQAERQGWHPQVIHYPITVCGAKRCKIVSCKIGLVSTWATDYVLWLAKLFNPPESHHHFHNYKKYLHTLSQLVLCFISIIVNTYAIVYFVKAKLPICLLK